MPVIVETGTGINPLANSYVSESDALTYAQNRGELFPADTADITPLLIKAMDYLTKYRSEWPGVKTAAAQPLAWPREGAQVECHVDFPNDEIPTELKNAQMQLAVDAYQFGDLNPTTDGYAIAREKVDVIEIEYAAGGRLSGTSLPAEMNLAKATAWIDQLLYPCGQPAFLTSIRI